MVDAHQDVAARVICGEGFPNFYAKEIIESKTNANGDVQCIDESIDWLMKGMFQKIGLCKSIKDFNHRSDEDGNPLIKDCQNYLFFEYYATSESFAVFEALYENHLGMQDKFIDYWDTLSRRYANNKYVIGYDPLNEPMPSNVIKNPFLVQPKVFDRELLGPMYEKIY